MLAGAVTVVVLPNSPRKLIFAPRRQVPSAPVEEQESGPQVRGRRGWEGEEAGGGMCRWQAGRGSQVRSGVRMRASRLRSGWRAES